LSSAPSQTPAIAPGPQGPVPSGGSAAIEIDTVTKTYATGSLAGIGLKNLLVHPTRTLHAWRTMKRHRALDGVSFSVRRGECLGVIGRNGSGKSTLLGLVAGVLWPDSGSVRVAGRICPLLELGAGFHPELTGIENAVMNGVLLGMPRRKVLDRLDRILDFAELGEFVERPLRMYSSGMVARLGFAVAVHVDPDVLLMDEVLSVGDERFRKKCTERLQEFRERGVTMLFVSHAMESVLEVSNRVAWLRDGRIEALGDPTEVVERYREVSRR
jgi:lipopolysaccharide transport system ATP-binding protein